MAIVLKSRQQIAKLRDAGRIVAETFAVMREHLVPGVSTAELDRIAEEYTRKQGAVPIYKGYGAMPRTREHPARQAFPATVCVSVNDVICHGIPTQKEILKEGDILGLDIGVIYNGWVGDACVTYGVGRVSEEAQRLMDVAHRSMELGIEQARANKRLGDIGAAIQRYAEANGFSVVREYTGHGVGQSLHEEPTVLHYGNPGQGLKLRQGMVFTIEPMINMGRPETRLMPDQWTVRTADGSLSAQFEHTIAITDGAPELLTAL
jgi:methionyl aminopeptidase